IRAADGQITGVTGIGVDILARLTEIQSRLGLGGNATSYIVRVAGHDGTVAADASPDTLALRAIAASNYTDTGAAWDAQVDQPVVASGGDAEVQAMMRDIMAGRAGMRRMPQNGVETIWVYGPIEGLDAALLYVVPTQNVVALADQARDSIWNVTTEQMRL